MLLTAKPTNVFQRVFLGMHTVATGCSCKTRQEYPPDGKQCSLCKEFVASGDKRLVTGLHRK